MTATRDPDRLLRAWLDLMPTEAPDRAIAAALQAAETTRQARAFPRIGRWRFPMNRLTLIAATAALVIAALGGVMLLAGSNSPIAPTPVPTASPNAEPVVSFQGALWGSWVADAEPIPGLVGQGSRIQAGFNWDGGRDFSVQTDYVDGRSAFQSDSLGADPGQFRLRARATADGCSLGDVGTYRWERSIDGLFLTVTLVADPCTRRASTLARTWVRTLGAANDGGTAMALMTDPYPDVQVTLDRMSWAMDAIPPVDIHTYGAAPLERDLIIYLNPQGFGQPCEERATSEIEPTAAALAAYLEGLPAASAVTSEPAVIDALPATHLTTIVGDACTGAEIPLFTQPSTPTSNGGTGVAKVTPETALSLWVVVRDGDLLLFWYSGASLPAAEEQAVIDSIKFTDGLPTP